MAEEFLDSGEGGAFSEGEFRGGMAEGVWGEFGAANGDHDFFDPSEGGLAVDAHGAVHIGEERA